MAGKRRSNRKTDDRRPVVTDDFIYNDPDTDESGDAVSEPVSDTPEEAIRKLRRRNAASSPDAGPDRSSPESSPSAETDSGSAEKRTVYSSGIMLDENLQPVQPAGKKIRRAHPVIRGFILVSVTLVLILTVASYIFHRISDTTPGLDIPEKAIGTVVTPVQDFFSGLTETLFGYFRSMKLRANIEAEYNELRARNEQLEYKAMLADELQNTLQQYEDMQAEIEANKAMSPVVCTVIGRSDSNYFSTLTINKGTADGITDYMAVTISGALVGYTESTQAHKATVRTIIDSDASIAALIQSSRDQGTVRGTLGIDGKPMCRMYYLPDDNLPRPGDLVVTSNVGLSFPKGIPIGTVQESTRGMDANKQYIVISPKVDFQHLEYVIVLRYKPEPEAIEGRENGRTNVQLQPLESARPSPVVPEIASSLFDSQESVSPDPNATVTPSPTPTEMPTPTPTPTPVPTPTSDETPLLYNIVNLRGDPTPTPTPTSAPTSTPYFTPDPDGMTFEEDE
ncbi:MAG: rod shape-determining protein MreC [Clostridiales bacterium]|nr:rod shape-determining protein MreC [Clostridiales bacterium]